MVKTVVALCSCLALGLTLHAALRELKPGWNLFSPAQDIQLGHEAATEITKDKQLIHDQRLEGYVARVGHILAKSPHAGNWPYEFHVVNDKNVNAFALPGGVVFVNTGAIVACDNEAQLAAVMAHEMSHVALRHGTHQITKAAPVEIAGMLAGALFGRGMIGQLARAGIGLTAGSVLLRFSREAEAEADYNGVIIMADSGYNPLEMAHFFEKLEGKAGSRSGRIAEFLSDHPNPGNRVKAIGDEVLEVPRKQYATSIAGGFPAMKGIAMHIAPPDPRLLARPSADLQTFTGRGFTMQYPANWQVLGDERDKIITIAPKSGIVEGTKGESVGYGLEASFYQPESERADLDRDTQSLIRHLSESNPGQRSEQSEAIRIAGRPALATVIHNRSPYPNENEIDWLVSTPRPEGLFYIIFIAPQKEFDQVRPAFERMLQSVRFN